MIRFVDDLDVVKERKKGIKKVSDLSNGLSCMIWSDLEEGEINKLKRKPSVPFTFETCVIYPRVGSRWEV